MLRHEIHAGCSSSGWLFSVIELVFDFYFEKGYRLVVANRGKDVRGRYALLGFNVSISCHESLRSFEKW